MTCEVRNKEIDSQCAKLLVRPLYNVFMVLYYVQCIMYNVYCIFYIVQVKAIYIMYNIHYTLYIKFKRDSLLFINCPSSLGLKIFEVFV